MNGRLRTGRGDRAHRPNHEVLEQKVAALGILAPVFAEIGDLAGLRLAGAGLEGALEGRGVDAGLARGIFLRSRAERAHAAYGAWGSTQQRPRAVGERCHCCRWEVVRGQRDNERRIGWMGVVGLILRFGKVKVV